MSEPKRKRCMVCGREKTFEGSICPECQASIRGEAMDKQRRIRKEAERDLKKEGVDPKKK